MRDDPDFLKLRTLCESTFFSVRSARDVPAASMLLKDRRDDADEILGVVIESQRLRASNVSWQAAAERLLYIISEEIVLWQP